MDILGGKGTKGSHRRTGGGQEEEREKGRKGVK
jgi:hypothetical protein